MQTPGARWRARRIILAAFLILLIGGAGAWFYVRSGPRVTPKGQPPLARLAPGDLESFSRAFDGAGDRTRILVLLSPT
jgi:hypothetical protein